METIKKDRESKKDSEQDKEEDVESKQIKTKTQSELTFEFDDRIITGTSGRDFAKLEDITATLIKRNDGTSDFIFGILITSLGWRTDNSPFHEGNPRITITFKNESGGVLFSQRVETEHYGSYYHGLTVKCDYDEERKAPEYSAGDIPFESVDRCEFKRTRTSTWYKC